MRKKTAGLAALICAAGLISVTQTDTVLADGGFSYEDVANREFLFCSGAGAWSTVLTINEDGSATIFINRNDCKEMQRKRFLHVMKHLGRNDFDKKCVQFIEAEAHQ